MAREQRVTDGKPKKSRFMEFALLFAILAIPVAFYFLYPKIEPSGRPPEVDRIQATFDPSGLGFERKELMPTPEFGQLYTNLQLVDAENGKGKDIIAADARTARVLRLSRSDDGSWSNEVLNQDREIPGPGHVTPIDLDQDGDQDFLISCIGGIQPTNDLVGRVVWLENDNGKFTTRDVLTFVRRVTDVQCADFDGDNDIDMVVSVFGGLIQGQILYLENDGNQNFTDYELMNISGSIHVPVADFDGDGDMDFAAIVSQEEEQVLGFENPGTGFKGVKPKWIFTASNFDLGTAGMVASDLDQDGDQDLILSVGDNLELINNAPQPWHGVRWLENKGDWNFETKEIAAIGGVYGAAPCDLDGDGDTDVAVVTMFNDWLQDGAASVLWLENDGNQNFKTWQIASEPIQLATVTCGDINGDGKNDIVTGSFHFRRPFAKYGSVDAFINQGGEKMIQRQENTDGGKYSQKRLRIDRSGKTLLPFLAMLVVELAVCGYLYYQKASSPTPPIPNLAYADELTRTEFEELIAKTKTADEWSWLASVYLSSGYFSEANAAFKVAAEMDPDNALTAYDYGFCLARSGKWEESNEQFYRAIDLKHPNTFQSMFFIGRNFLRGEQPEKAKEAFRKSSRLPIAKFELAKILFREGEYDEADELLSEVVSQEPGTPQTFVLRSQIAQKRGDRVAEIGNSMESQGMWVRIRTPFGDERKKIMGNFATLGYEKLFRETDMQRGGRLHLEARRGFKKLQEMEWNVMVQEKWIELASFTGRVSESIKLIEEKMERFGPSSSALETLGQIYFKSGEQEKALEAWKRGIDLNSDKSARTSYKNVANYYLSKDEKTSLQYQAKGLIHFGYDALTYDDFEKALPMAMMATRYDPKSAEAQFLMGRAQLGHARLPEAIAAFEKCLELDPTFGRAKTYLESLK